MDTLEFRRQLQHKFNNLPKAKRDEIAWYQAKGMTVYANRLFMDAIGVQVEPKDKANATPTISESTQTD